MVIPRLIHAISSIRKQWNKSSTQLNVNYILTHGCVHVYYKRNMRCTHVPNHTESECSIKMFKRLVFKHSTRYYSKTSSKKKNCQESKQRLCAFQKLKILLCNCWECLHLDHLSLSRCEPLCSVLFVKPNLPRVGWHNIFSNYLYVESKEAARD